MDDTVMIVQMKGAEIDMQFNALISMNYTGRYEFVAVQQVVGNVVKFRSNFINTYDASQTLQIVRVPYYQSARVTGTLTCDPWSNTLGKGGVLAFIVADTLELQADINVSGQGFRGGASTWGNSTCYPYTSKKNFLVTATDSAGLKGESFVEPTITYFRGRGGIANSGGGGNGFGSGGGGGAGFASGGQGGQASNSKCPPAGRILSAEGGEGGTSYKQYFAGKSSDAEFRDRIFMGGGGGSSRGVNSGDASAGGNGGGLIFIIANNVKNKNGYSIKNNGADAVLAINDAGGGGGGGGGSIMLSINNAIDPFKVEVKGGQGGKSDCTGQGGGGGGGFVWFSDKSLPFASIDTLYGKAGGYSFAVCGVSVIPGTSGNNGDSANYLNPVLNGFLFNLIGTNQTICYGEAPKRFSATKPRGGNGVYAYQWQYRNKSTLNKWTSIPGANSIDYQSSVLTDTTDFRRVVSTTHITTLSTISDSSKWITVKVRPEIKGLTIAPPDTAMCMYQSPIKIRGLATFGGDGSPLSYAWEQSTDNATWASDTPAPNNLRDFTNTSNQFTRYYRRKVENTNCKVYSNTAHITVHPRIKGNKLQPDTVICMGALPNPMRGDSTLIGGSGIYHYQWLKNTSDSVHWAITNAKDTFATYNTGTLNDTFFYRRIVYSGQRNTCTDTSKRIKVTVLPLIGNNSITQNQTMCQNTSPQRFIGTKPTGGDKSYWYRWESSSDNVTWQPIVGQPAKSDSMNYKYGVITTAVPAYFRRTIFSGAYNCCASSSASIKMTLQPKIQNNVIVDSSEICWGQSPPGLAQKSGTVSGGDNTSYVYLWQKKAQGGLWRDSTGANLSSFLPGQLFKTTYFRRKVTSGTCISYSDSIKVNVLDTISGNQRKPGGPHEVCETFQPESFVGATVTGGKAGDYSYFWYASANGTSWNLLPNAPHTKDYQSTPLTQDTYFRRVVKSGYNQCCISIGDTFLMKVSKHPSAPIAGSDQKLPFKFNTNLHAKAPIIGWGTWTTKNEDITISFPHDTATEVNNLPFGNNVFYWTTANGSCPTVTDSVVIEVDDIKRYNAFSPNNDGTNDKFEIEGAENSRTKKLHIFDRWGGEVYSSDNYKNDWDGTAKNGQPLPEDTYYYVFEADGNRIYKGFIVIKR